MPKPRLKHDSKRLDVFRSRRNHPSKKSRSKLTFCPCEEERIKSSCLGADLVRPEQLQAVQQMT
jgi:hypothetical protein